jgi:hypothetical protein
VSLLRLARGLIGKATGEEDIHSLENSSSKRPFLKTRTWNLLAISNHAWSFHASHWPVINTWRWCDTALKAISLDLVHRSSPFCVKPQRYGNGLLLQIDRIWRNFCCVRPIGRATLQVHLLQDHVKRRVLVLRCSVFWDITPCSALKINGRSGVTCRFHLQGRRINQARD